jgi:hypothetical protein
VSSASRKKHFLDDPSTTPCCGRNICRQCLPTFFSQLAPAVDAVGSRVCVCGKVLTVQDQSALTSAHTNPAFVELLKIYRAAVGGQQPADVPNMSPPSPSRRLPPATKKPTQASPRKLKERDRDQS